MNMKQQSGTHTRRSFHQFLLTGLGFGMTTPFAATTVNAAEPEQCPQTCEEAVNRLLRGNQRFVTGNRNHQHIDKEWRARLTDGQQPFATILGCSDSRVPPEILFDQGFGDLFVVRVAGNIIDVDIAGSVEYGVDHLETRVVVVMGHEGCGAVTAAVQAKEIHSEEPNEIRALVAKITPALNDVAKEGEFQTRLASAVEANVRHSVQQLKTIPAIAKAVLEQRTQILGCVYDLDTGRVRTL